MWVCLNNGFISVVESDEPDVLMVRARERQHLVNIFGPHERIHVTPRNDYRFRVFISRLDFAELMAQVVIDIDYSNFKDSVVDNRLHDLYVKFWNLHYWFQNKTFYPRKGRGR